MPNRAEPPRPPRRIRRLAGTEMRRQAAQPRLVQTPINDLEQRPDRPLRQPRIGISVDPRRRCHRVADEPARRREFDIRAYPIATFPARPDPIRHSLCQPALHPARGHGDDLRREWIGHRIGQERTQRLNQAVGPLSSMDVEHGAEFPEPGLLAPGGL
jgi:hypothetical protein